MRLCCHVVDDATIQTQDGVLLIERGAEVSLGISPTLKNFMTH